jgi:hypothetical protein
MTRYEYRVVPAPQRGVKTKGARTTEARFAHALTTLMNELAREGWEYLRSDTLPCEERVGLTGRTTRFQSLLVFRRMIGADAEDAQTAREVSPQASDAPPAGTLPAPGTGQPAPAPLRLTVAERLAATLTARTREGAAPPVGAAAGEGGAAPRLGAASGQGLSRPDRRDRPAE